MSVLKLTKIQTALSAKAIDENHQAILALLRVLTESCNKLYYLSIEPKDELELSLRWTYFLLVGRVKYKRILKSISSRGTDAVRDRIFNNIGREISEFKKELERLGLHQWRPFLELGPDLRKKALDGMTQEDCLKKDFERVLSFRLKESERMHFQDIGSVAVHSSSFIVIMQMEELVGDEMRFITGAACLFLFNAVQHLALCGLELLKTFPELRPLVDMQTKQKWGERITELKHEDYVM